MTDPAVLSLIALVIAVILSMTSRINVGWLAIAFAWIIGVYPAGLSAAEVMSGFPVSLFLTLGGVMLLFAVADANGTLGALARLATRLARGDARVLPVLFFVLAGALSSVGPGAIASVALLVPLAMAIGLRAGVSPLVTALMIANGANAGNLSPISSVGIIANSAMAKAGLVGHEGKVWFANFAAHALVAAVAYALFARRRTAPEAAASAPVEPSAVGLRLPQRATIIVIAGWIAGVIFLNLNLGLSAFAAATLLLLLGAGDDQTAVRRVPWGIIMMVSGVTVLIALLEKTGGMTLFTAMLSRTATASSINGIIAFVTGAISTYSSTSGVVLPTFLPTASGLVQQVGGGDPLAVALSINVGSSLVDVSPLSTLGALSVAALADPVAARQLFRQLMAWGLSMSLVGALLCQLFAGWLAAA